MSSRGQMRGLLVALAGDVSFVLLAFVQALYSFMCPLEETRAINLR